MEFLSLSNLRQSVYCYLAYLGKLHHYLELLINKTATIGRLPLQSRAGRDSESDRDRPTRSGTQARANWQTDSGGLGGQLETVPKGYRKCCVKFPATRNNRAHPTRSPSRFAWLSDRLSEHLLLKT